MHEKTVRILPDAYDLARRVSRWHGESIAEYVSRVVHDAATADLQKIAEEIKAMPGKKGLKSVFLPKNKPTGGQPAAAD